VKRIVLLGLEVIVVLLLLGAAYWYYVLDGSVGEDTSFKLDIAAWRELVRDDAAQLPSDIRVEFVGRDLIPFAAVEAGGAFQPHTMARTAFQVNGAVGSVIIDSGMDKQLAESLQREGQRVYDERAYGRVLAAMGTAARVAVTHEHADHIGGVARFPEPGKLAPRLALTKPQLDALSTVATGGTVPAAYAQVQPIELSGPVRIAPGVVMIPAGGHTPGSVLFYVRGWGGRELLFIGDVAWSVSNVRKPAVRPRLIQDFFMTPPEQRAKVSAQVRALHALSKAEPALIIVPSHDDTYLAQLIASGVMRERFAAAVTP
jgi:glyoxylase-like metal-dependent hydrolase (beta-lactamase superfamily II)